MNKDKVVFVIPGFKQKPKNRAYQKIAAILKTEGYSPILVNIPWSQTTISENTETFLKKYRKINSRKKYILGFSFGAMIAFLASTKVSSSGLILCSLAPYFKEDLLKSFRRSSQIRKDQYHDFSKLHCAKLAKKVKTKQTLMLYGTREAKSLKRRVNETFDLISSQNKFLFPIRETEHNIGDRRYLNKIHQIARELN